MLRSGQVSSRSGQPSLEVPTHRHREALLVNPGSVGLPFRSQPGPVRISRWAEYGIVTADDGRVSVELCRASFDVDAYLELARSSGMPHADWWLDCWTD